MWTRIGLKVNAKKLLMKNYWRIVLVAFILALVSGGVSATINARLNDYSSSVMEKSMENMKMPSGDISDGTMAAQIFRKNFFDTYNQINQEMYNVMKNIDWFKIQMIMLLGLLMAVAYIVFSAFIFAPIEIGCRRWFLMNRTGKPEIKEIVSCFTDGYINTVKIMFCQKLFIGLWSLLFIIPGIIKAYEYRMIPYILAENPDISFKDAFAGTKQLMYREKWDAFVLDISFIGWVILASLTSGILSILFVTPYRCLTNTELYVALKTKTN